jgi:hypothetical protein
VWWKYIFIYKNGNMKPFETIPGMGSGENKGK